MSESSLPPAIPPPQEFCRYCGSQIPPSGSYCPRCGATSIEALLRGVPPSAVMQMQGYMAQYRRTDFRVVAKTVSALIMVSFVVQLAVSLGILVYGAGLVIPDIMDKWAGYTLFLVVPVVIELVTLSGLALAGYYILLVLAIIVSCLWIFATSFQGFRKELTMKAKSREHSALFETVGLLFATLFFSALIGLLVNPPSDELPSADTVSELLFALANASVWEELIVRVLFIGLPLVFVDLIRTTRHRWHTYLLGGGFSLGIAEVVLIIVSSAIFGIGHYTGGWGAWKILPATVGGLAFGYLFLRFGIVASITMHFGTDYLSMPSEVTGSYPLAVVTGLGILVWLGAGSVFFGYYATRVTEFLTGKKYFDPRPVAYPQPYAYPVMYAPAPAQQYPAVSSSITVQQAPMPPYQATPRQPVQSWFTEGYVCPNCGSTQARWVSGRFQCLRCGRLS